MNLERLAGGQSDAQVAVLAHEYGHVMQTVLGGYDRKVPAWFDEGFAEWVRTHVLDSLNWRNTELASRRAHYELGFHQGVQLSVLEDRSGWAHHRSQPGGYVKTYVLASYAVDQLIRAKGFPAALNYLKTSRFEESFGQSQRDFEAMLMQSLRQIRTNKTVQVVVPKPEWKVGYSWRYEEKQSVWKSNSLKVDEIVGRDATPQVPVFFVKEGDEVISRSVETLGMLETRKNAIVKTRRNKPSQNLAWPLQSGKSWREHRGKTNLQHQQSNGGFRCRDSQCPCGYFQGG